VNALEIARGLWEITHATTDQTSKHHSNIS
jgi:hypothetical protein